MSRFCDGTCNDSLGLQHPEMVISDAAGIRIEEAAE
jgi:hypothetical protein